MNICSICGKPIFYAWGAPLSSVTVTLTSGTGDTGYCPGYHLTTGTTMIPIQMPYAPAEPQREPVPVAFQDAFDEDLYP